MRDPNRLSWNQQQQALRQALSGKGEAPALDLFLAQHAMVHAAEMSGAGLHSFEDEVWAGLPDEAARRVPAGMEHSIAWCLWHLTRIEDMTLNVLVAGETQLFDADGWSARLGGGRRDTGNALTAAEILALSRDLDLSALRAYRIAVGRRTREIVRALPSRDFKRKTDPARLRALQAGGSLDPASAWLADYWGGLTVAGLLLMPPTRHPFVHHNEGADIRKRALKE
jgi:hypothetical protein